MVRLLSANGADPEPEPLANPITPSAKTGGKSKRAKTLGTPKAEIMAQARAADEATLSLLRAQPGMRSAQIATATNAQKSTCAERLRRLARRGLVERTVNGWQAAATA
jgi:hypothetical protein